MKQYREKLTIMVRTKMDLRTFTVLPGNIKCFCGCGDNKVKCDKCGFVSGYRHRSNHVCVRIENPRKEE